MAKLIYSVLCSLDGYYEDAHGGFDWAAPDDDVVEFVNELERPIGTYLYGRRMYETMVFWETAELPADESAAARDFVGIWRAADKLVFSRTLQAPSSAKTRIKRAFTPEAVRMLKQSQTTDLSIGGGDLAGQMMATGLVDEFHLFMFPVVVGGGRRALPAGAHVHLDLLDERRFDSGVVHLHYGVNL